MAARILAIVSAIVAFAAATCPDGSRPVNCLVAPCRVAGNCSSFPNAVCNNDYCGGCNAVWTVDGKIVDCNCPEPVRCFVAPCRTATCPAHPNAVCGDDYCHGSCKAIWTVDGKEVSCEQPAANTCPDGSRPYNCLVEPCKVSTCPAFPNAVCGDNYCGGCKAEWTVNGEAVDCNAPAANTCPDGSRPVNCLVEPCAVAGTCSAYPNAVCHNDYCGGCNAVWKKVDGTVVDCNSTCPEPVRCFAAPCSVSKCDSVPNAVCGNDYCHGSCLAVYTTADGQAVDCSKPCGGLPQQGPFCNPHPCAVKTCPNDLSAECHADPCTGCGYQWISNTGLAVAQDKCDCPAGKRAAKTCPDMCSSRYSWGCPKDRTAKCHTSKCGGCHEVWTTATGTPAVCW